MADRSHTALMPFNSFKKAAILMIGATAIFFVYEFVLTYFIWSEEAYGPYYWQYRVPLIIHIAGALTALLSGLFQLWTGLSATNMNVHPTTGKIYLTGVAIGASGAFILSVTSSIFGLTFGVGLFCMALVWVSTSALAVFCIRKRNIRRHKQWMIRSYIITFSFITFRIFTDYLPYEDWWGLTRPEISNATIWVSWAMPLIAYEIYIQFREVKATTL